MIDWRVALVVWGGFLILTVLTRYVSLGSLLGWGQLPLYQLVLLPPDADHCTGLLPGRIDRLEAPGQYPAACWREMKTNSVSIRKKT